MGRRVELPLARDAVSEYSLDRLLLGGLREGQVTELVGNSATGKSQAKFLRYFSLRLSAGTCRF